MGEGAGSGGEGGLCPGILWAIVWFFLLLLAWWLAGFIAWIYILLLPFSVCISPLEGACEALLTVIQLPKTCAENMVGMKPVCG